jgi:hypothetical protein
MKKSKIVFLFISIILFFSCSEIIGEKGTLTDQKIQNYIQAYKGLRENAPQILANLNQNGETIDASSMGFLEFEQIIKDAGLEDYPDFVRTNAKIGVVFSLIEANKGMKRSENLEQSSKEMIDDAIVFIQSQIDNPDVPEETKEELRQQIEEHKKNKKLLVKTYSDNTEIANLVIKQVEKIRGMVVNQSDVEAVERNHADLYEAFTGFPEPPGMDGKLPKLQLE